MHLGLIIDEERLRSEHAMLARLVLRLIDEGQQVTRIIPAHLDLDEIDPIEAPVAHVSRIPVPMRVPLLLRAARAGAAAAALSRAVPDLLVAVGRRAWPTAQELAQRLDRPATFDVWCADLAGTVPRTGSGAAAYLAATAPLAEALRQRVEPELVSLVPYSTGLPANARTIFDAPEACITAAIIGGGRDMPCCTALLAALAALVRETPQLQVAIELVGPHAHAVWREARRLGLLGRLSAVPRADAVAPLVTGCDLLLLPERRGAVRSIILDAMARGMAIVAVADPYLDMLIDGETAALTGGDDTEGWLRQLRRLIQSPEAARGLGEGARRRVKRCHQTGHQAAALLDVAESILRGGAIRMPQA
jgi:hypothetical protein